ncbi:hypothetical protein GPJ56_007097 [Histomonas meleagridis]|uniref:uncharacterized protein n=1 Tax=Histomonas meleagridis TaxID=135588 RepID=UPI00355A43EF|nr:hypothetical protein GPJ56_007097 [Histomonas meleagridis]KAH0796108.1 hypothetical protein GO595_011075 [Histomonas meleagridis]
MDDELKVNIQWLPGAILPVVTHRSSTAEELSNLLQFSCFEHEKVYLFHNGLVLNPSETLGNQGIKKGDVIECKIVSQIDRLADLFIKENQSIAREMARVLDIRTDKIDSRNEVGKTDSNSSYSDSDSYQFLFLEGSDLTTSNDISSDPLPIIWQNDDYEDIRYKTGSNKQSKQKQDNPDARNDWKKALPDE